MNKSSRADEIALFVRVVERGSFAAAARTCGLTPGGVSRAVSRLEDRLGVRLLQRTTRRLAVTPEGETLLARGPRFWARSTRWRRRSPRRAASRAGWCG